jgi:hypothetical protein
MWPALPGAAERNAPQFCAGTWLDRTGYASHKEQASVIRLYIIWRNNHPYDERLRRIIDRTNIA